MATDGISRRSFLKGTAGAVAFPYVVSASALGKAGAVAASERIVMGCIGVGQMGTYHLRSFLHFGDVQVVATCDVRRTFRDRAQSMVNRQYGTKGCTAYNDFRELLARENIDAVTIVTPEHWHGLIAIEAANRHKAMYCEKPLDVNFAVSRAVRDAVNRNGVVFQLGCQQRSDAGFRRACELVRNGRLGKLHTIMVGSLTSGSFPNQPNEPAPDKKEFDYDMWLGPAKWTPYSYQRCASRAMGTEGWWTHIHDYSLGGISGAYGIHHIDIAQMGNAADDTGPVEIWGTGVIPEDGLADTEVEWEVEGRYANGVRLVYMDTKTAIEREQRFKSRALWIAGCGVLFIGSEGWVIVSRAGVDAEPKSLLTGRRQAGGGRPRFSNNHRRNFLDCVKSGRETVCPIEAAVRSDAVCHLSDVAIRLGRKLRWDPDAERCIGDDEANRMLSRPMRSPWHL